MCKKTFLNSIAMKKTITILAIIATVIFTACDEIPGPVGPPGEDGVSFLGKIFETPPIDFTSENNYEFLFEFPTNFEIYETDIVMVYILWEQVDGSDNQPIDVWRALPQTIILNEGILQYNFDYTFIDVKIFLDGDIDFRTLLPAEKDNQIFRIAVLPAEFAKLKSVDINDFGTVMEGLQIQSNEIQRINF